MHLAAGEVTAGLAELLALAGGKTAFAESSRLIERFLLFRVSDNTLRKETEWFGDLFWATTCQRKADLYEELVFVCDGAVWIWKLIERHFPQTVQIVDWYHASEYLPPHC